MANKYEAILPCGSVAKRGSKNRTYVACIAVRFGYAERIAWSKGGGWADTERSQFAYYQRQLDPASRRYNPSDAQLAFYAEEVAGFANADEYIEACLNERLAQCEELAEKGYFDQWQAESWAGRPDLIAGAMSKANSSSLVAEVRACPAILK